MELKLPPALLLLLFGFAMYILATFLPFGFFDFFGRLLFFKIMLGFGGLVGLLSLFQFYRFTRNPMYLALLISLLALGVVLGNAFNTLIAAAFVEYMNRFQIIPEERILLNKFGRSYKEYCTLTRRWF